MAFELPAPVTTNIVTAQSIARVARARLAINNQICLGLKEITARSAAHMSSDTWQAKIATGTDSTFTNRWFSQANVMQIDAYYATGAPGQSDDTLKWQKVISGIVDRVTIDPDKNLVTLDGRDLSASLSQKPLVESYSDLSPSQIAAKIAHDEGYNADVDDDTGAIAGSLYGYGQSTVTPGAMFSKAISKGAYLDYLAQSIGFTWGIIPGNPPTLYFKARGKPNGNPIAITYSRGKYTSTSTRTNVTNSGVQATNVANVISVELIRNLTLAGDIDVTVLTHNPATGVSKSITQTKTGQRDKTLGPAPDPATTAPAGSDGAPGSAPSIYGGQ